MLNLTGDRHRRLKVIAGNLRDHNVSSESVPSHPSLFLNAVGLGGLHRNIASRTGFKNALEVIFSLWLIAVEPGFWNNLPGFDHLSFFWYFRHSRLQNQQPVIGHFKESSEKRHSPSNASKTWRASFLRKVPCWLPFQNLIHLIIPKQYQPAGTKQ